ncbi:hypothetical protein M3611_26715 [Priestia megaterium]|uniref:hypothetical protein n=1 Tax=Priestia megaterium TaxID=1404 RepID=UPI00203BFA69|nr:hypothetical protein [Priestia megaterium]MCM3155588.1 hypothetical protein [Priestia megaterium]
MENYYIVESWSAYNLQEMDAHKVTLEGAKDTIIDFWENDDLWDETFDSEEELDEFLEETRNSDDIQELSSKLDGIGYWLFEENEYLEAISS